MVNGLPSGFCPFKGLQPYTEQDRAFFFGRGRDQQVIISNLYAAPLTTFYGESGVGKSSVLLAGALPLLKRERNLATVVFRNWQDAHLLANLKQATQQAVSDSVGREIKIDSSPPLDQFLAEAVRALRGPIFLIFDQFEEYFLYNPTPSHADRFEAELASAINRRDVTVNFLLSMREDSLSKLDRFQGRIPTLLNNMLRLEHLDRDSARDAITKPLEEYNRQAAGQAAITIEEDLVDAVLDDLTTERVSLEQTGEQAGKGQFGGKPQDLPSTPIETPLLQMVMTRLWEEETAAVSSIMRLQTYEALGRARNIARTHLDTMMARLTEPERNSAANVLRYLVTPSGTKIAQEAGALVSWTELRGADVKAILTRLSAPDMRILRTVQAPGQPPRHEIFHDVMAQAILDWRRRYVARQEEERILREAQEKAQENLNQQQADAERRRELERARRLRSIVIVLSAVLIIMAVLLFYALRQRNEKLRVYRQSELLEKDIEQKQKDLKIAKQQLESTRQVGEHMRQAQLYLQARKYSQAIQEVDKALELDPTNSNAYNLKGYGYLRSGNYEEAVKNLKRSIESDPANVWGHYNLALAYWAENKPDEAVEEVKAVLKIDPSFRNTFKDDGQFRKFKTSPEYVKLIEATP